MIKIRSSREKQGKLSKKTKLMILLNTVFIGLGFGVCFVLHNLIRKSFGEGTANSLLPALAIGIASLIAVGLGSSLWLGYELLRYEKKENRARPAVPLASRRRVLPNQVNPEEVVELDQMIQSSLEQFDKQLENQKQFVADAIHELNTPAALLRLSIDSYRKRMEGANIFDYVFMDTLDHATVRIENLIKQIEKLDAEPEQESYTLIDVPELIQQVGDMVLKIAAHKRIEIQEEVLGTDELYSNLAFLQSILLNLLDNAIKYSPEETEINVLAECWEEGCKFVVQDQGIGISEKDLPHVLKRFYRTSQSRSRKAGGSGLGLAITDEMVRKLGGKLIIESELGKGTTVNFWIPNLKIAEDSQE
jgi:signal transduction histidine kinase